MDYIAPMDEDWLTHELKIGPDTPIDDLIDREWLLVNGDGSYAMGTVPGCNTRRYHGLLVGAMRPPVGRVLALNQVLEHLVIPDGEDQQVFETTSCRFHEDGEENRDGLKMPWGCAHLTRFEKGLTVRWTYELTHPSSKDSIELTRELSFHWQQPAVTLQYEIKRRDNTEKLPPGAILRLSPMLTLRDFHALTTFGGSWSLERVGDSAICMNHDDIAVTLDCQGAEFRAAGPKHDPWWYGIHYPKETERSQKDQEDYFVPGYFRVDLPQEPKATVTLTVALGRQPATKMGTSKDRRAHLQKMLATVGDDMNGSAIKRSAVLAVDDFVVHRQFHEHQLKSVIAGYPWFADWGRDTFIALPGLMLVTGRFDEAKSCLKAFAEAIQDGLVPCRFDDYDQTVAHYYAVDASLWFIHSALEYVHVSDDHEAWQQWLADATMKITEAFLRGTSYDIRMAGDGLIAAGSPTSQLTWMDASCDGTSFTPRYGKAVEINSLWYNALTGIAPLIKDSHERTADHYVKLAQRVKRSFSKVFWDESLGYLRDRVWTDGEEQEQVDSTLRPNQILAASLPRSPLPATKQRIMLEVIRQRLLTPFGLRTLPVDDPNYQGRYTGPRFDRDKAYHQGTVWPWLVGPYAEAVLRLGKFSDAAKTEARQALEPLLEELTGRGMGQISEIYEGDPPHRPVGCMAKAWSVAELLRVLRLIETR